MFADAHFDLEPFRPSAHRTAQNSTQPSSRRKAETPERNFAPSSGRDCQATAMLDAPQPGLNEVDVDAVNSSDSEVLRSAKLSRLRPGPGMAWPGLVLQHVNDLPHHRQVRVQLDLPQAQQVPSLSFGCRPSWLFNQHKIHCSETAAQDSQRCSSHHLMHR